ncbi:hypothetical protein G7Y89_g7275 [Cudoniella acicularis]|uniref:FAD dependent oxidoreductase domain-containing protein n=1 Tax=Cudoniella acicularis TaxID=354080 RepID=A0A8H4RL85_9HELO|nr:hypothetical protein G7Y89_g7275 [Cudoniella acicularis]
MDERAAIPVTLPHPSPTTSYWQDPPDAELADFLSSETVPNEVVGTLIIGSGITGAGVAWNLLQNADKKERIVMLEARQACSGATGRNGGHTKAASYRSFPSNVEALGLSGAMKIVRLEYANIRAVHAFAAEHKIDCESRSCDTVDIIYDQAQWDECVSAIQLIQESFTEEGDSEGVARYQLWGAEEAKEKFLVKGKGVEGEPVLGAVSYEAGSLSAYKFVIGLLKLCLKATLEFFTNTPATKLTKGDGGIWDVETPRGVVRARRVVLATNGYTGFISNKFQGSIVPLRGQITAHRPSSNMPKSGLETTYSFIYSNGYEYMIPRPQTSPFAGDIIIGGGLVKASNEGVSEFGTTDDSSLNTEISSYLRKTTTSYFGESWGDDDKEGRIRREWTGIMGYSADGFPFVGTWDGALLDVYEGFGSDDGASQAKCSCGEKSALHCTCGKAATENAVTGARCSCRARPAGSCNCERSATENTTPSGDLCSCGARPATACTCEKATDGGLLPTETDFTNA